MPEDDACYLASRAAYAAAADLMDRHGDAARDLATAHATQSRIRGNLAGFCHWRQIERAIAALSVEHVTGTVH